VYARLATATPCPIVATGTSRHYSWRYKVKRRDFLQATAGLGGILVPGFVLAAKEPCPPGGLNVRGGTAAPGACASESNGALPFLQLASEAPAGTYAWTVGQAFRRGHVMNGVTAEGESIQCDVRNRWSDGSIKFALLSGISNINKVKHLQLAAGAGASGSEVTESRISTILGDRDVSLSLGTFGTVSLRSLVGSGATRSGSTAGRVRTAASGPVMSEFHYMGIPSGGDAHLRVWFYVRVYSNDTMEVETVVENGWLRVQSPGQRQYAASMKVLDEVLPVNGGTPITHFHHTRWSRTDWVGADPRITPRHDGTYLRSTGLVPNYGYMSPGPRAFQKNTRTQTVLDTSQGNAMRPVPFSVGTLRSSMGVAGELVSDQIGLLPYWEALAITSGDSRAINASIMNARCLGRYAVYIRDESTLAPPSRTAAGYERLRVGDGSIPWPDEPTPTYARSHHPSWGYYPYLITGRWQFWEGCALLATYNHFQTNPAPPWPVASSNGRDEATGICVPVGTNTRMLAWQLRTLAQASCMAPDGSPIQSELRAQWSNNMDHYWGLQSGKYASYEFGRRMENNLGIVMTATHTGTHAPLDGYLKSAIWMHHYVACALGFAWDLEINPDPSSKSTHENLRNHAYKSVIGMCGIGRTADGQPLGFSWRRLPNNYMAYGDPDPDGLKVNDSPCPLRFWSSWSAVYERMLEICGVRHEPDTAAGLPLIEVAGVPPPFGFTDAAGTLDTVINAHLKYATTGLAYAADHRVAGAAEALARIHASSSWRSTHAEAKDYPTAGVIPRA